MNIPVNETEGGVAISTLPSSGTDTPLTPEVALRTETVSVPETTGGQNEAWVPSGGRKLETGLSIVLENVAAGFKRPNVLDVKLGSRLWADDAAPAKRVKLDEVSRQTTSSSLGFRIAGMKVWAGDNGKREIAEQEFIETTKGAEGGDAVKSKVTIVETDDGYRRYDKWYGRSFTEDNVKDGFETFLAGAKVGKEDHSKLIAKRLATELRRIQAILEKEQSRMYSASILIVYEGDPDAFDDALNKEASGESTQQDGGTKEEEEEEDKEEGEGEGNLSEGSLKLVDVLGGESVGQDGLKIEIDPQTAQLEGLGEDEDEDEDEIPHKVHDIRLIDFAHASWTSNSRGPDENVLHGIRSLSHIMEQLAEG